MKAAGQLRFDLRNIHKQCSACNSKQSGNIVEYRINLIARIGEQAVLDLESDHRTHRWTIPELRDLHDQFKAMADELERRISEPELAQELRSQAG